MRRCHVLQVEQVRVNKAKALSMKKRVEALLEFLAVGYCWHLSAERYLLEAADTITYQNGIQPTEQPLPPIAGVMLCSTTSTNMEGN